MCYKQSGSGQGLRVRKQPIILTDEIVPPPALVRAGVDALPAIIRAHGERASRRFIEFFTANIRNRNTRAAYARAVKQFFDWTDKRRLELHEIEAITGKTACVSAGAAGGGVTEKPARCSHRLRVAPLGRPDALRRRRTAQDRQQRGGAGATADRVGPEELALRRERSSGAPHRHPVFAGADLQAPADQSVRVSARCHRARLDASGAAGPGADATRVEAPAAGFRRASRRLNGAFLTIRPRLLPVSSIPIYLSIGTSDHVLRYWPLDGGDVLGPTLTTVQACQSIRIRGFPALCPSMYVYLESQRGERPPE
jgi:hypothetical protein